MTHLPSPEQTSLYTDHWVDGEGPLDAEIVLVGQAPGATEAAMGRPFVGPAGRLLQRAVADAGLDWASLRRTNTVRCRPPKNRAPTPEEIREYWPWLEAELGSMPRLRVIVALGNEALYAFSGRTGVTKKRGQEFEWRGKMVLPTLHPAYVLRDPSKYQLLVADLRRAASLGSLREPAGRVEVVPFNPPPGSVVAVDVETWQDGRPRIVGYAVDPDTVHVVHPDQLPLDADVTWLGHNVRVDERWLGMRFASQRREDTMLMAHLLDENRPVGLKSLAQQVLGTAQYWRDVEPLLARRRDEIPDHVLARYCANDVAATLLLFRSLSEELSRYPRLEALYRHLSLPLSGVLMRATDHGVYIDLDHLARAQASLAAEAEAARREIAHLVPEASSLNLQSHEQVAHLLYDVVGLVPPRRTPGKGAGATDERTLRSLDHPVAAALLRFRRAVKRSQMLSTWRAHVGRDGRVHPDYLLVGTVTGRLSSRDPNAQNLPTDPEVRGIVAAPEGYALVWADYATIELVVAAWLYGERSMLEAYLSGEDLHTRTATVILGRPPADKEERKRYGKTPNFGLLYMQSAEGFREYAAKAGVRLTIEEAFEIRSKWHAAYPGVREGWRRYHRFLDEHGYVEAPSGRRRRLPGARSDDDYVRGEALRQAVNFPVQCTAAEFTHVAAILLDRAMPWARLVLHVHDSLVFETPVSMIDKTLATVEGVMRFEVPRYCRDRLGFEVPVPLRVELGHGERWGV